jgi:hypothetical protein
MCQETSVNIRIYVNFGVSDIYVLDIKMFQDFSAWDIDDTGTGARRKSEDEII